MFCQKCGAKIDDQTMFCPLCGNEVIKPKPATPLHAAAQRGFKVTEAQPSFTNSSTQRPAQQQQAQQQQSVHEDQPIKASVAKNLTPGEYVVCSAKWSPWMFLPSALFLGISFIVLISVLISTKYEIVNYFQSFARVLSITFILSLPGLKKHLFDHLVITNKKIFGKKGIIRTKTLESPVDKIQNLSVSSKLLGKIFGYGTISITTASGAYLFSHVAEPESFKNAIMGQIGQAEETKMDKQAYKIADAIYNYPNK